MKSLKIILAGVAMVASTSAQAKLHCTSVDVAFESLDVMKFGLNQVVAVKTLEDNKVVFTGKQTLSVGSFGHFSTFELTDEKGVEAKLQVSVMPNHGRGSCGRVECNPHQPSLPNGPFPPANWPPVNLDTISAVLTYQGIETDFNCYEKTGF